MSAATLVLFLVVVASVSAEVTDDCLACMCYASSNGCVMPDPVCNDLQGYLVCGPWAITEPYWIDGGQQGGDFLTCVADWACNEQTVRAYLDRYVTDPNADCETYARTHVGGPFGVGQDYTLAYWYEVKDCLDYGLFTPAPVV